MKKVSFSDKIDFLYIKNRDQLFTIHIIYSFFLFLEIIFILCVFYSLYNKNYLFSIVFFIIFYFLDGIIENEKIYDFIIDKYNFKNYGNSYVSFFVS